MSENNSLGEHNIAVLSDHTLANKEAARSRRALNATILTIQRLLRLGGRVPNQTASALVDQASRASGLPREKIVEKVKSG